MLAAHRQDSRHRAQCQQHCRTGCNRLASAGGGARRLRIRDGLGIRFGLGRSRGLRSLRCSRDRLGSCLCGSLGLGPRAFSRVLM